MIQAFLTLAAQQTLKQASRYFLSAAAAFIIFWVLSSHSLRHRKIGKNTLRDVLKGGQVRLEITQSISTILIFSAVMVATVGVSRQWGIPLKFYSDIETHGIGYLILSAVLLVAGHDAYFYFLHRLLHQPVLFKWIHYSHHRSVNPTPFAIYSFHPVEAVLHSLFVPLVALTMPIHPFALGFFIFFSNTYNTMGHLGFELFPKNFTQIPLLRHFVSATHHNLHHQFPSSNFGLYTRLWDQIAASENPDYLVEFKSRTTR